MPRANFFTIRSFYVLISNVGFELLLFLISEFAVRFIIPSPNRRAEQLKFLTIQSCILAVFTLLVYSFHHTPFLLTILTLFVFSRLLSIYITGTTDETQLDTHVSKPLRKSLNTESVVPLQLYPVDGATNYDYPSVGLPQGRMGSSLQQRFTSLGTQQGLHASRAAYPHHWTWKDKSPYSTSVTTTHITNRAPVQPLRVAPSTELSQAPLKGSHVAVSGAAHSQNYLQCISSLWAHSKPSECPPGISNSGNVCFVNSTLQTLAWTPGFLEALKKETTTNVEDTLTASSKVEVAPFLKSLHSVLDSCHVLPDGSTTFDAVSSASFLKSVSELVPYLVAPPQSSQRQSQQDASEFLLWLLDNLGSGSDTSSKSKCSSDTLTAAEKVREQCLQKLKSVSSKEMSSCSKPLLGLAEADWILQSEKGSYLTRQFFLGQIVEARECQICQMMSVNVEYFTVLPLPIPESQPGSSGYSLGECFANFGNVEELNSSNMMVCPCSSVGGSDSDELILTPGVRRAMLSRLPLRMIIQLSRFSYDTVLRAVQKKNTPIIIPMSIDISQYLMESKLDQPTGRPGTTKYSLYALCIHTGAQSTSYGHYLAYCRASNDRWYCFNDSSVSTVDDMQQELQTATVLQNAYLLFYTL